MMQGSLPHKLRVLRMRRGLTLIEAAALTGVTRATLSDLERGHRHPVAPTLAKIAKGYGVPIEDLLVEEEPALAGKAEAPEEGPGRETNLDRADNLEVLRRMAFSILHIAEQCRTALKSINIDAPDRKATADQLISLLAQAYWSYRGAKEHVDQDEIVQKAATGSHEERRGVRKIYVSLDALYDAYDDISEVVDSFAKIGGEEDAAIIHAEERFRRRTG